MDELLKYIKQNKPEGCVSSHQGRLGLTKLFN